MLNLKKENGAIKDRTIRDIRNLFEHEQQDYYNPVIVSNIWSNNYIEYENNGNRKKTLLVKEYLNKISPYLKFHKYQFMVNDKADEGKEELFESLLNRYQIGSEASVKGSDFIFDCVYLLHYKCHKINFLTFYDRFC